MSACFLLSEPLWYKNLRGAGQHQALHDVAARPRGGGLRQIGKESTELCQAFKAVPKYCTGLSDVLVLLLPRRPSCLETHSAPPPALLSLSLRPSATDLPSNGLYAAWPTPPAPPSTRSPTPPSLRAQRKLPHPPTLRTRRCSSFGHKRSQSSLSVPAREGSGLG